MWADVVRMIGSILPALSAFGILGPLRGFVSVILVLWGVCRPLIARDLFE